VIMMSQVTYCEMCGKAIERRLAKIVYVEGAKLTLCPSCHARVSSRLVSEAPKTPVGGKQGLTTIERRSSKPKEVVKEEYEVVEDYADRIRRAREALGWSQKVLAEAVKESENVIKRLESGRLVPTIDLARRLEKVLNIRLLEPVVDVFPSGGTTDKVVKELTLGDVVNVKSKK